MHKPLRILSLVTLLGLAIHWGFSAAINRTIDATAPMWYHVMMLLGFELMAGGLAGLAIMTITRKFMPGNLFVLSGFMTVNMWGLGFFANAIPLRYAEPLCINAFLELSIWFFLAGSALSIFQLVTGTLRRNNAITT